MRILIFSIFILYGCSKEPIAFKGIAHTHPYHIQIGHFLRPKERKEIQSIIELTFEEIDQCYNHWNPDSDLSRGNQTPKIQAILSQAQTYYELTDGYYNPTLGSLVTLFKQTGSMPKNDLPQSYDLDGMLKGFTIDLLISRFLEKGYKNLYVEWGGDLRVKGIHPKGRKWQILLNDNPFPLDDSSIATSGCQQQLWKVGTLVYTHIIDPHNLKMIEVKNGHVHKVSVMAPTCALADALATACMACSTFENATSFAKKIKKEYPEVEFWITSYEL